jgi:division protein CdvB (Snf7/Vps24/ESCRT-III family)
MSEEELEAKMKKILDDYAPILNAKVVDALPEEVSEPSLSSSHKTSEKQNAQKKVIDPSSSTS